MCIHKIRKERQSWLSSQLRIPFLGLIEMSECNEIKVENVVILFERLEFTEKLNHPWKCIRTIYLLQHSVIETLDAKTETKSW